MATDIRPDEWPGLLVAATILGLAAWVVWLDFASRLHRAFGLFLFVTAMGRISSLGPDNVDNMFGRASGYFQTAVPFAAANFVLAYLRKYGLRGDGRAVVVPRVYAWMLLILYTAAAVTLALPTRARSDFITAGTGPLFTLTQAQPLVLALLAFLFHFQHVSASADNHRASSFYLGLGFIVQAVFLAGHEIATLVVNWVLDPAGQRARLLDGWNAVDDGLSLAALGVCALLTVVFLQRARHGDFPHARARVRNYLLVIAAVTSTILLWAGVYAASRLQASHPAFGASLTLVRLFGALWTLFLPVLAAYAIVRYRFLGADRLARLGTQRGVIAFVLLAVFFVVAQLTQNYLNVRMNWAAGGVAAGLLLFAMSPIQKLAERMAAGAVPQAKDPSQYSASERRRFYEEQLKLAWKDGALTVKEKRMLDRLREQLGLAAEDAARLERQVLQTSA